MLILFVGIMDVLYHIKLNICCILVSMIVYDFLRFISLDLFTCVLKFVFWDTLLLFVSYLISWSDNQIDPYCNSYSWTGLKENQREMEVNNWHKELSYDNWAPITVSGSRPPARYKVYFSLSFSFSYFIWGWKNTIQN